MKDTNRKLTVVVTGVGGGGLGEQIIKALRLSDHIDYTIVGTDMSPVSKGLAVVDKAFILPRATDPSYIDKLLSLGKAENAKVIFPGSEIELLKISERRKDFESAGFLVPINPHEVIELCLDKFKTNTFFKENGYKYPRTYKLSSLEDVDQITDFPVVLKPSVGGGGSANVMIAQNSDELYVFCKYLFNSYAEFIVQEYVGTAESEFTVGILSDMDGNLINSIAVKRNILSALSNRIKVPNLTDKKELGAMLAISSGVSQGEIGKFPEVTKICEEMAQQLGSTSAINIQCRIHNGQAYVFEINPRFSGTTSLRALVGYNEPDVLIRKHIFEEDIEVQFPFREGHILRGLEESFLEDIQFKVV